MICCKLNRRGRASDIFLIIAQNINAGESHGGSHTWLFSQHFILCSDVRGWSGGAMVLGKLPVPGRPTYLE